jgi:hypothetical protein
MMLRTSERAAGTFWHPSVTIGKHCCRLAYAIWHYTIARCGHILALVETDLESAPTGARADALLQ